MATMIPNYCHAESPGEKELFDLLRECPDTDEWVILHSLHIARHVSKVKGEADFVVLVPSLGILVLEVKSHTRVSVREGSWFLGSDGTPSRSPFVQAESAMFSIRQNLQKVLPIIGAVPFLSACWFTSTNFPKSSAFEWQTWQVLNFSDKKDVGEAILSVFRGGIAHLRRTVSSNIGVINRFTQSELKSVVEILRPNFEFMMSEKLVRSERKVEMLRFAEEQFAALDLFEDNDRGVFMGPAGTGKTLLAVEMATRGIENGKRVVLVCFNRFLADHLTSMFKGGTPAVFTIDSFLLKHARKLDGNLPRNSLEALQRLDYSKIRFTSENQYDLLIIDEAQDVLVERYVGFLDQVIAGGFSQGSWYAFGDFEAQRIYNDEDNLGNLRTKSLDFPIAKLTKNCRNVIQIGHFAQGILPRIPHWRSFLRTGTHPDPLLVEIPSRQDMVPLLDDAIKRLLSEAFSWDDIVVLSPVEIDDPSKTFGHSEFQDRFANFGSRRLGSIGFTTISKFKGLDSPCVIALDLDALNLWANKDVLLYTLLTRPTDRLIILANKVARMMLVNSLVRGGVVNV